MAGLVDFLFPKRCVVCGSWGAYICAECLNRLQPLKEPICPMCGKLSLWGKTHGWCQRSWGMAGLVSVYPYAGAAKKIVTQFKYKFVRDLLGMMTELVITNGEMQLLEAQSPVVVGVPLHSSRERWRGYNQAELLGKAVAGALGWRYGEQILRRNRPTTPQMKLKGAERLTHLRGAFEGGQAIRRVRGRVVVIVDDVWTTGATIRECAGVLRRAGACDVYGLTFARSLRAYNDSHGIQKKYVG